jgi:purine-nucleoside/S-methyl-5'-thioadenosine phosphorylase / adenosine deaminase
LKRSHGLQILQAPPLSRLAWLLHGFSTRPGGSSELKKSRRDRRESEKVLNLGFTDWDLREHVVENRNKFFRALGAEKMHTFTPRQIHSDIVSCIDAAAPATPYADALVTRDRGILIAVQTADCIPILLADTKNRAVAAIHSGWRGTLGRIAEKTLGRMRMDFGTDPEDVIAAIGPGIGRCCYEVGSDVAREFNSQFSHAREWFDGPFEALAAGENDAEWLPWLTMRPPGHPAAPARLQLDLLAANRSVLVHAGVPATRIFSTDFCTACRSDLFFSYRRESSTGRLMAAIGIR